MRMKWRATCVHCSSVHLPKKSTAEEAEHTKKCQPKKPTLPDRESFIELVFLGVIAEGAE